MRVDFKTLEELKSGLRVRDVINTDRCAYTVVSVDQARGEYTRRRDKCDPPGLPLGELQTFELRELFSHLSSGVWVDQITTAPITLNGLSTYNPRPHIAYAGSNSAATNVCSECHEPNPFADPVENYVCGSCRSYKEMY
jgi:hypothetical protein